MGENKKMLEKIKGIICTYTDINPLSITLESSIRDLGLNSYDFMNIIAVCEEEFSISIPDREIYGLITVGDIVQYLERAIG